MKQCPRCGSQRPDPDSEWILCVDCQQVLLANEQLRSTGNVPQHMPREAYFQAKSMVESVLRNPQEYPNEIRALATMMNDAIVYFEERLAHDDHDRPSGLVHRAAFEHVKAELEATRKQLGELWERLRQGAFLQEELSKARRRIEDLEISVEANRQALDGPSLPQRVEALVDLRVEDLVQVDQPVKTTKLGRWYGSLATPAVALDIALRLFQDEAITQGEGAIIARLSRCDFINQLLAHGISPIQEDDVSSSLDLPESVRLQRANGGYQEFTKGNSAVEEYYPSELPAKDAIKYSPSIVQTTPLEVSQKACPDCKNRGLVSIDGCNCGTGGDIYGMHEPFCGLEPCPTCCIWWDMTGDERNAAVEDYKYAWPRAYATGNVPTKDTNG